MQLNKNNQLINEKKLMLKLATISWAKSKVVTTIPSVCTVCPEHTTEDTPQTQLREGQGEIPGRKGAC